MKIEEAIRTPVQEQEKQGDENTLPLSRRSQNAITNETAMMSYLVVRQVSPRDFS